jgi:rhodanese-related sulfurtransferase
MIRTTAALVATMLALVACSSEEAPGGRVDGGSGWTLIDAQELNEMMAAEDVYLVNVHVPYEGEIPRTDANIPYTDIASRLDRLPAADDVKLVIYCRSGNMSGVAARALVDAGVTGFYELEGGYQAWQAAGLPFDAGP